MIILILLSLSVLKSYSRSSLWKAHIFVKLKYKSRGEKGALFLLTRFVLLIDTALL